MLNAVEIDHNHLNILRKQLKEKYPDATDQLRAELLSDALWQQVRPFFAEFPEDEAVRRILNLFSDTLIVGQPLTTEQIRQHRHEKLLDASLHNNLPDPSQNTAVSHRPSKRWMLSSLALLSMLASLVLFVTRDGLPASLLRITRTDQTVQFLNFKALNAILNAPWNQPFDLQTPHPTSVYDYEPLDKIRALSLLKAYESMLTQEPYLSIIESIAKDNDVHPALLLSIIGQEQGFVSQKHPLRKQILQNPYNLFGSWEQTDLSFTESTTIAARLVRKSLESCPISLDPLIWLNYTYAEDENWHRGVRFFYQVLTHNQ